MKDIEPFFQTNIAKKAEAQRPQLRQAVIDDPNLNIIFTSRAATILSDLQELEQKKVPFSPFLEIGAGNAVRSVALINNYPVVGVATDISQNSLLDTPYILSMLNYKIPPMLICCDAHHLPFMPNSFRFIFTYQTLHHFNNPTPVLNECYRILAKEGFLFFNEEPMDSSLRRLLRGKRLLSHPPTKIQKLAYRLGIEKIFWDDGAIERSLGMSEARYDLDLWRKSLEPFTLIDIEVNKKVKIHTNFKKPNLNSLLSGLIGGNVKGLCMKSEGENINDEFQKRIMCLDCGSTQFTQLSEISFLCKNCNRKYPVFNGVIRMLPQYLENDLFPESAVA